MIISPYLIRRPNLSILPVEQSEPATHSDAEEKARLRRQMYERIARGNALADVEDNARQVWRDR